MVLLSIGSAAVCHAQFHTNTITTPGGISAFSVDGSDPVNDPNPVINLVAGVTNIFDIQTSGNHPVVITTNLDVFGFYPDANPQNVNDQPIEFSTPSIGFPTVLYYLCFQHGFGGEIHFAAPPSPVPGRNTILQIRVGTNIVMTSTGTNTTWLFIPEFSSNLMTGVWAAVPNYTNSFANGTNTTVFGRLDPICGPNVFLRVRQQEN